MVIFSIFCHAAFPHRLAMNIARDSKIDYPPVGEAFAFFARPRATERAQP